MTKWIVGESYQHRLSGVKIRMIGWTTDGRPVVERHEQPFDQYSCYDLAKCAIDFYDHVPQRVCVEETIGGSNRLYIAYMKRLGHHNG